MRNKGGRTNKMGLQHFNDQFLQVLLLCSNLDLIVLVSVSPSVGSTRAVAI